MVLEGLIVALLYGGLAWLPNGMGVAGFEAVLWASGIFALIWTLIR